MRNIQQLSEETINQIAAGEVVESPAAALKELIENAVDAGATRIVVEVVGGGFALLRVSDNGVGMSRIDARLCFQRHTTSKLKTITDLDTLSSMGFRGEALASIAAVAKVELITSDLMEGTRIVIHGGKLLAQEIAARERGTTITVESLFYNTPGRKGFQKSVPAVTSEIVKVVTKAALATPTCDITLISQGETLLSTQSMEFTKRVKELLGWEGTQIDYQEGDCRITGLIGSPQETRINRSGQYLFINHRPIISYLASSAILEGYGTRIDAKRFPLFALHFHIPGHLVDVNVHPQKTEVRFKEEKMVASLFRRAVLRAWQHNEAPEFVLPVREGISFERFCLREKVEPREEVKPVIVPVKSIKILHVVGRYALFQDEETLWLIDLLAARARLVFDQVMAAKEFSTEQFLFPEVLEFPLAESKQIAEHLPALARVGIVLRPFGKGSFLLEGLATFLSCGEVKDFLAELFRLDAAIAEKWAEVASRYAKRLKVPFTHESAKTLIETFYRMSYPEPAIVVPYTEKTLEALFA